MNTLQTTQIGSLHPIARRYPVVHIRGAFGARAAVLVKHKNAKPRNTGERGEQWPIYAIMAGKLEIGRGHGTSDAWERAACAMYSPNT
jgi:hypothetical protein